MPHQNDVVHDTNAAATDQRPPEAAYPDEPNRWMLLLGTPMLAACISVGLAFGTGYHWLYAGAILFGPGFGVFALMYLAISSDTNGAGPARELGAHSHHSEPTIAAAAAQPAAA